MPLQSILPNSHYKTLDPSLVNNIMTLLPYVIHITDCQTGKLLFASKNLIDILGYNHENILPDNTNIFIQSAEHYLNDYKKESNDYEYNSKLESRVCDLTYEVRCKDGRTVTLNTRSMVHRTDEKGYPTEVLGISEDVTEKVKAAFERERMNTLLNEAESVMNFGSWTWYVLENKIIWSDGLYRIFGYDPADRKELETTLPDYYEFVHPDDLEGIKQRNAAFLETGEQYDDYEHRIINKNGEHKTLIARAKVVDFAEDGKTITRVVGSTIDATYLKKMQRELEQKVTKLNLSNRDLEQFAYVASHDLQEPLRKIMAFGERLHLSLGDTLDEKPALYLDRVLNAASRMRELIDNLLSLSRLTNDNLFEKVDLNEVLREVLSNNEISIEDTQAKIVSENLPIVDGVRSQLGQLFNNLLSNAIKFRKNDQTPEITISNQLITVEEEKSYLINKNKYLKFTVADNGIGFDEQYAEQIFTIFKRLHGRTEYAGTGIGLAICRKLIDNHNGFIYAASAPMGGTVFTIILPKENTAMS